MQGLALHGHKCSKSLFRKNFHRFEKENPWRQSLEAEKIKITEPPNKDINFIKPAPIITIKRWPPKKPLSPLTNQG